MGNFFELCAPPRHRHHHHRSCSCSCHECKPPQSCHQPKDCKPKSCCDD